MVLMKLFSLPSHYSVFVVFRHHGQFLFARAFFETGDWCGRDESRMKRRRQKTQIHVWLSEIASFDPTRAHITVTTALRYVEPFPPVPFW